MTSPIWEQCLSELERDLTSQQFNTWLRPLQSEEGNGQLILCAPNKFVMDWVKQKYYDRILSVLAGMGYGQTELILEQKGRAGRPGFQVNRATTAAARPELHQQQLPLGGMRDVPVADNSPVTSNVTIEHNGTSYNRSSFELKGRQASVSADASAKNKTEQSYNSGAQVQEEEPPLENYLSPHYTFEYFVEGKSNQLALAAARQVAENSGGAYNPLFIYGGVGLGKTHLMQAVGHSILRRNPKARVMYLPSETFVQDMVKALQRNAINEFKRFYRSLDALLIDDIQFFAGKDRSQEEFFHTFNALLEGNQQVILTCDRFHKEIDGVEDRLKSRFSWGLTVQVEPPELETRVAILMKKADETGIHLPQDAAFFIAQLVRSNVRELEGALKRVVANAHFTGSQISISLIKESLRDLLDLQKKQVSIENIQRTVAEYFKIKVADLNSKRRSRSVARPRQVAMALAKELTNHSLPEIGDSFGGRDHTTVLHACKKVRELRETDLDIREDYDNLLRTLTT